MAQFPSTTAADGIWSLKQQRRALLGSAWPALSTAAIDEYFANVVLLLHGDGTSGAQNNTFLDSSSNNFTITRNGNTTQGSYSPYGDRWSNYFDGTGDYLDAGSNSAFAFGTGDFTIEGWVYRNGSQAQFTGILSTGTSALTTNWQLSFGASNNIEFLASGTVLLSSSPLSDAQWYHVAVTRSGTTVRLFINGVLTASGTNSNNFSDTLLRICVNRGGTLYFSGYISDARIVKGTALYTSNFTPPTEPLTAVSGTSLLTCQSNRFKDNSSNDFAITVNGDTKVTPFSPYAPSAAYDPATDGGSGYFDGTGDYLTVPSNTAFDFGAGDFTMECWFYRPALLSGEASGLEILFSSRDISTSFSNDEWGVGLRSNDGTLYFDARTSSGDVDIGGGSFEFNQWNHFAIVRSGTTFTGYLNGVALADVHTSSASIGNSTIDLTVGNFANGGAFTFDFTGYISDLRIIKGTALYTSNFTPPTAPLTAVTNTSLLCNFTNAGIFDSTGKNVLETVGNAQIDTAVTKFGTGSMEFDGTGDLLLIPAPGIELEGDFTIEAWVNRVGVNNTNLDAIFTINTFDEWDEYPAGTTTPGLVVSAGTLHYGIGQVTNYSSTIAADSLWHHIACVRQGSTINVYIDGASVLSVTNSDTYSNVNTPAGIGVFDKVNGTYRNFWNGYIDDLRITKGVARYTANFTPPTEAFPDQ